MAPAEAGLSARSGSGTPKFPPGVRQQTPPTPGGGSPWALTSRFYSHRSPLWLGVLSEFGEDQLGHFLQRFKDALTGDRHCLNGRLALDGEILLKLVHRKHIR